MSDTKTIIFHGTCPASSNLTLCSNRISRPFKLLSINASFALNTNRLLKLYFYASFDPSTPSDSHPLGTNVLSEHSPTPYLVGDDDRKVLSHSWLVPESGSYLKVFAVNSDTFPHAIDAQCEIEELTSKEA